MICTHLKELYQLCESSQIRLGSSDLIRIVCKQCEKEETCPSMLMDEYDSVHTQERDTADGESADETDEQ